MSDDFFVFLEVVVLLEEVVVLPDVVARLLDGTVLLRVVDVKAVRAVAVVVLSACVVWEVTETDVCVVSAADETVLSAEGAEERVTAAEGLVALCAKVLDELGKVMVTADQSSIVMANWGDSSAAARRRISLTVTKSFSAYIG